MKQEARYPPTARSKTVIRKSIRFEECANVLIQLIIQRKIAGGFKSFEFGGVGGEEVCSATLGV